VAELCSGKFFVAKCREPGWKLPLPPPLLPTPPPLHFYRYHMFRLFANDGLSIYRTRNEVSLLVNHLPSFLCTL
jgi:hypothetical protein